MTRLEIKSTLIAVDNDLQQVQQRLEDMVQHSSTLLLQNLVEETRSQIAQAYNDSTTDRERAAIFDSINQAWFRLWEQFKHIPEAIDLIKLIDKRTTQYTAYTRLFYSVSMINEATFSEYDSKLMQAKASGFILLAEVVDVYKSCLSSSDLKAIYQFAQEAMASSSRSPEDYWETDLEHSSMITQVKGACSLIIASVEQEKRRSHSVEPILRSSNPTDGEPQALPWWESIVGVFEDDSTYDEAMQLGRQYRMSSPDAFEEVSEV